MVAVSTGQTLAGPPEPFSPSSYRLAAPFEAGCQHTGKTAVVVLGHFRDQQALYGLLSWLRDLGATLLLVKQGEDDQALGTPGGEI